MSENKPALPSGVTQEQIDGWKAQYGDIHKIRIGGLTLVVRVISYREIQELRQSVAQEESLVDRVNEVAVLYQPAAGKRPAGFKNTLARQIAQVSGSEQGHLLQVDSALIAEWPNLVERFPQNLVIDLPKAEEMEDAYWIFLSEQAIVLLRSVTQQEYEQALNDSGEEAIEQLTIKAISPRYAGRILELPFGTYESLMHAVRVVNGFEPEEVTLL